MEADCHQGARPVRNPSERRRVFNPRWRNADERILDMTSSSIRRGLALGLAGAVTLATPSFAAPVLSSTTAVKAAAGDNVVDVQWRRWHRGGWRGGAGLAAGLAVGALAGAAIGAATAPYYYGYPAYSYGYSTYGAYPGYAYSYPAYGAYAYEAPVTYGSAYSYGVVPAYTYGTSNVYYPYQTCGVSAGYGRWDYSQC
jgi:hypothetical protein